MPMPTDLSIRPMRADDADQVVAVHMEAFRGFFLTQLGPGFLCQFYAYVASSTEGVGHVAVDDSGQIVGFVCGSIRPSGLYGRFVRRRWQQVLPAIIGPVLRRPAMALRLGWRVARPPQASEQPGTATLFSIGVHSHHQCQGVGTALVQRFLVEMSSQKLERVNLTTDRDGKEAVNGFYRRLGFELAQSFVTPEGRWMNEYTIHLGEGIPDT